MLQRIKLAGSVGSCFLLMSVAFNLQSCKPNFVETGTSGAKIIVTIQNPEFLVPIGAPGTPFPKNNPGYEVEVVVNTLNSQNQATYFSTKVIQANHSGTPGAYKPGAFIQVNDVEVPESGGYVIEYTLRSKDCTWPQTKSQCQSGMSRKYFKGQHTFPQGGQVPYTFLTSNANKYNEECC